MDEPGRLSVLSFEVGAFLHEVTRVTVRSWGSACPIWMHGPSETRDATFGRTRHSCRARTAKSLGAGGIHRQYQSRGIEPRPRGEFLSLRIGIQYRVQRTGRSGSAEGIRSRRT